MINQGISAFYLGVILDWDHKICILFAFEVYHNTFASLGSYHFLPGGGGGVCLWWPVTNFFWGAGGGGGGGGVCLWWPVTNFFWSPPFAYVKTFWSPPLPTGKNFGPPLWLREKILVPPPQAERTSPSHKKMEEAMIRLKSECPGGWENFDHIWTCYVTWSMVKWKVAPKARKIFE